MAIVLNDNIDTRAGKPTDSRFGTTLLGTAGFYTSVNDANAAIPAYQRYIGLTVGIKTGVNPMKEYWYANGIANGDLVEKSGTITGAGNGLSSAGGIVNLGGNLTQATTINTSSTNTLTIGGLQTATTPTHYVSANSNGTLTLSTVSSLTTTVQNAVISAISATNGLTKTGSNIKLGGTLIENTSIPLGDNFLTIFNNTNAVSRSESTFRQASVSFDTFDTVVGTPNIPTNDGSRSRIISTKASNAMWTTNYLYNSTHNPAYRAWENWLVDHPWIVTKYAGVYPLGVPFQILDNLQSTSRDSAIQAHYFDERVGNSAWSDTWANPTLPNSFGSIFPGWTPGDVYTLRTLNGIDDFTGIVATTISGTPYTSGWVFEYTSGGPALWVTSIVDGDFPIVERDPRTSLIVTSEGSDPGDTYNYEQGVINVLAKTTFVTGLIDQIGSTAGIRIAQTAGTNTATLPTTAKLGEMLYSTALNKVVVRIALSGPNQWISLDSTTI